MSDEILKLIFPALSIVFGFGAFYGLIRAELRHISDGLSGIKRDIDYVRGNAEKSHERLDAHVLAYHKGT